MVSSTTWVSMNTNKEYKSSANKFIQANRCYYSTIPEQEHMYPEHNKLKEITFTLHNLITDHRRETRD